MRHSTWPTIIYNFALLASTATSAPYTGPNPFKNGHEGLGSKYGSLTTKTADPAQLVENPFPMTCHAGYSGPGNSGSFVGLANLDLQRDNHSIAVMLQINSLASSRTEKMANKSEDISKRQPTSVTITYNPTLKLMKVPLSPTAVASPLMKRRWDNFGRKSYAKPTTEAGAVIAARNSYKSSDFHVITANTTRAGGNLSRLDVDLSAHLFFIATNGVPDDEGSGILALNNGFCRDWPPIQARVTGLHKKGAQIDYEMKAALRVGDEKDLNVYTVAFEGTPSLLGYSAFPEDYEDKPIFDGVLIHYRTTPGGGFTTADQGKNLVHEVGHVISPSSPFVHGSPNRQRRHWVGLFHPFQGSCDDSDDGGDMIGFPLLPP
ncbi:hypothetical protein BT69DRAFT_1303860 [Atractiella rhizophila]|nr:hypothetical protein BT69DRAFT_1303860 [Atractiella rhizophila]